jgi:large subunit ribosomal protein L25
VEQVELDAKKRTVRGKQIAELRAAGRVPAVLYGHGVKSEPIEVSSKTLERVYRVAGGNKIIDLKIGEGRPKKVLIYDIQRGPLRGELTHADFYAVKMDEELKADVPIHFIGESTAVYQDEGTLVKGFETVEVECFPADLPESIEVDISVLDDFEKTITLADLKIPQGVKLTEEDLTAMVAKIEPPRSDEELAELEEKVEEELPEGVAEGETDEVITEENEGNKDRGKE